MYSVNLIALNPHDLTQVEGVSKLHHQLLEESPIAQLGNEFMTKFYYSKLVETGLIRCDLYVHKGNCAGFIAYTKYPFTFMAKGLNQFFICLTFLLIKSIILNPYRLKVIFQVMRQNRKRQSFGNECKIGEVLSFGVLKDYRGLKDGINSLRISHLLFRNTMEYFRNEGYRKLQVCVKKDNKKALKFYRFYMNSVEEDILGGINQYLLTVDL
jgi:hypothetical protein